MNTSVLDVHVLPTSPCSNLVRLGNIKEICIPHKLYDQIFEICIFCLINPCVAMETRKFWFPWIPICNQGINPKSDHTVYEECIFL